MPALLLENRPPKTLVLCFDGTANEFDDTNTNVVKLFSMLDKTDTTRQVVYYQTGVGTYGPPGLITSIGLQIAKLLDYAFATYLEVHVMSGYKFIMDNYESGDKICLFGFSRGAYTARVLAAMLLKVGLLPRRNEEHIPFAWSVYKNTEKEVFIPGENPLHWHSLNFKRTFSREVEIEFLGIWDTVASVGLATKSLPFTANNPIVRNVAHAVSLDELRCKFRPRIWNPERADKSIVLPDPKDPKYQHIIDYAARAGGNSAFVNSTEDTQTECVIEQVWFAGDHCDVGGGHTKYTDKFALSHIPLRWMVREAMLRSSIIFDQGVLQEYHIQLYPSPTSSASHPAYDYESLKAYLEIEKADALSAEHSARTGGKGWMWTVIELIPSSDWWRSITVLGFSIYGFWPKWWVPRRQIIRKEGKSKVHSSVKTRLRLKEDTPYQKKVNWADSDVVWVDEWALPQALRPNVRI